MTSVGVRELRQRASELLRMVENGETIEITDRGRPVALLTAIPTADGLEWLRATGQVEEAGAELGDLPEPIDIPAGRPLPSVTLAALRAHER